MMISFDLLIIDPVKSSVEDILSAHYMRDSYMMLVVSQFLTDREFFGIAYTANHQ